MYWFAHPAAADDAGQRSLRAALAVTLVFVWGTRLLHNYFRREGTRTSTWWFFLAHLVFASLGPLSSLACTNAVSTAPCRAVAITDSVLGASFLAHFRLCCIQIGASGWHFGLSEDWRYADMYP